ncbi:MAG: NTP transferase domain-containing protein, partial [Magnetospiraceae bacterium]
MSIRKRAVIVLAAGLGTRMKSDLPKVLHPVAGRPMVQHLLATIETLSPDRVVVVVGPETTAVADAVAPHPTVIQQDRLGTAHAVLAAREHLTDFDGDVLVVFGDTPLITAQTLEAMLAARNSAADPAVVVLGFEPDDPGAYGRLVVEGGVLKRIVEF